MMRKNITFLMVMLLSVIATIGAWAQNKMDDNMKKNTTPVKEQELAGYLSDSLCGVTGYPEGYKGVIDLVADPANHPIMCLKMDNCTKAGYGIFIKNAKDSKYAYFKFDAKGSEMARTQVLDKIKDKMAKTPKVTVKGILKDGVITISSISIVVDKTEKTDKKEKADTSKQMDMKM